MSKAPIVKSDTTYAVAKNVALLRDEQQMTLAEASDRLAQSGHHLHPTSLCKLEGGERRIDVEDLVAFARLFSCSPHRLLNWADAGAVLRSETVIPLVDDATAVLRIRVTEERAA